jgi:hypothetical protein
MTTILGWLLFTLVAAPQDPGLALTHVNVVDVAAGELRADQTVVIQGARIAWTGAADEARVPAGATVIDAHGKYLVPGLWDMHVHIQRDFDLDVSLPMFLVHGVTGVRDMASDVQGPEPGKPGIAGLLEWRAEIEAGERVGPRLLQLSSWPVASDRQVGGDAEALIETFAARGVELVKVLQGLSTEVYFDVMFAAEERGLPVTGHVPLSVGMIEASHAGQVSIEHARDFLFDGFAGSAEWRRVTDTQNPPTSILRRMVDEHDAALVRRVSEVLVANGTRYVPTHVTRRFDAFADDPGYRDDPRARYVPAIRWDSWAFDAENVVERDASPAGRTVFMDFYKRGLEATGTAFAAGVEVLAGTDANDSYIFPGSSLHDELDELVKAGLTPAEALRAATLSNARFLQREADYGTVAAGKVADLVLLAANPLESIANARKIEAVVFDGRLHDRAQLDELQEEVAARVAALDPSVDVPAETLASYVGTYDSPDAPLELTLEDGLLHLGFPGRGRMRLRPRSTTEFVFLPREAVVTFTVEGETVVGLSFRQGSQGGTATKVR